MVELAQGRCPGAEVLNGAQLPVHFYDVSNPNLYRTFREQYQARYKVVDDALQSEANADSQRAQYDQYGIKIEPQRAKPNVGSNDNNQVVDHCAERILCRSVRLIVRSGAFLEYPTYPPCNSPSHAQDDYQNYDSIYVYRRGINRE